MKKPLSCTVATSPQTPGQKNSDTTLSNVFLMPKCSVNKVLCANLRIFFTKTHRDHKLQRNLVSLCELSIQQTFLPHELSFTSVQTTTHNNTSGFNSTPITIQVWIRSLSLLQSLLIFINYLIRNLKFPTSIFALLS